MKPSQLATLLERAVPAGLPILIVGAPGIGKTSIVRQAAERLGADLILSHPAVEDPTDARGMPWITPGAEAATFLPFGPLAQARKATKRTIWFLDDFGQAPPAVQAPYMQLMLAREVDGQRLPDHVTFVAATNRRTDRGAVSGILEPVKSRFLTIVHLTEDLDDWCRWALLQPGFPPEVIAFLRWRPQLLCAFDPTADMRNSPLPRTWENAARILRMDLPADILPEALAGAVGEGVAVELLGFLQMSRTLPKIDAILMDPDAAPIPDTPSALYAVATALAARADEGTVARVVRYAQRLVDAAHGEYAALLLRDATRRRPELLDVPECVAALTGELGQLVFGQVA